MRQLIRWLCLESVSSAVSKRLFRALGDLLRGPVLLTVLLSLILPACKGDGLIASADAQSLPQLTGFSSGEGQASNLHFFPRVVDQGMFPYDFTVTDLNGDGLLDISVAAHSLPPRLLINDNDFEFRDAPELMGIAFNRVAGDVTPETSPPSIVEDGLYLFMVGAWINVVGRGLSPDPKALRFIALPGPGKKPSTTPPFRLLEVDGDVEHMPTVSEQTTDTLFSVGSDFSMTLAPSADWFQHEVMVILPTEQPLDGIRLGQEARGAPSRLVRLTATLNADWHGMAWADLNDDGRLDLFAVQGGAVGEAPTDDRAFQDLLWLSHNVHLMSEVALAAGITKSGAPGRGVDLVDVDRNGLLDIYVRNSRASEPRKTFPNAMHLQASQMRFENGASELGLAIEAEGVSAWIDIDGEGWIDLIWGDSTGLTLHRNIKDRFTSEPVCSGIENVYALTLGDVDSDGETELVAAAWPTMVLVDFEGDVPNCTKAATVGLPAFAGFAQFVDVDGDGRLDLFTDPHGVFLQTADGAFEQTGLLAAPDGGWRQYTWADMNEDGRMDLVSLERSGKKMKHSVTEVQGEEVDVLQFPRYEMRIYENRSLSTNPWLQIDLVGPQGNSPAYGARVLTEADGHVQVGLVGQFEGSISSEGHRRLYFGFRGDATKTNVSIVWPDGSVETHGEVPLGQRLTFWHPESSMPD